MATFHAIAIDETQEWNLEGFTDVSKYISRIHSVYAVEDVRTYCCSLTPSAWCEYLYTFAEYNTEFDMLSEDDQEAVRNNLDNIIHSGNCDSMSHYRDWYSVQHAIKAQNAPCLEVEASDDAVEHWLGNCPF